MTLIALEGSRDSPAVRMAAAWGMIVGGVLCFTIFAFNSSYVYQNTGVELEALLCTESLK